MINRIDEHDMTKKMVNIIRGDYKKILIENQNDTLDISNGDPVYKDEYNKLSEIVDPSVDITNFKIYPVDRNVVIEGKLLNNKATFRMELINDEVTIDTGSIGLNNDNNEILRKLQGYFKNWKNEWSKKIVTDYKQNNS